MIVVLGLRLPPSSVENSQVSWTPGEACDHALDLLKQHETNYRNVMQPSEWKSFSVEAYATYFWNLRYLVRTSQVFQGDASVSSSLRLLLQGALHNQSPPSNSTVDETIRTCLQTRHHSTSAVGTRACYDAHTLAAPSFQPPSLAPGYAPSVPSSSKPPDYAHPNCHSYKGCPPSCFYCGIVGHNLLACTLLIADFFSNNMRRGFNAHILNAKGNALLPVYNARADTLIRLQLLILDAIRFPIVPQPPQLAKLLPVNLLVVEATAIATALSIAVMATHRLLLTMRGSRMPLDDSKVWL
ncbi:hypothetical protein LEN26_004179 [Aphanomyces euteiches]|nr:hypothetical protein AeMF1_015567 [Aphanomyces euteiches]KAH9149737.1 hypothetical protein LEN26_004179 [Aphanomyces euteiches]KAH9186213.1 hypothetical protein AeNC1_011815 [Aphanomyces euteiches]